VKLERFSKELVVLPQQTVLTALQENTVLKLITESQLIVQQGITALQDRQIQLPVQLVNSEPLHKPRNYQIAWTVIQELYVMLKESELKLISNVLLVITV